MEYRPTFTEIDAARQLSDLGLKWPYGVGDYFCLDSDETQVCVNIRKRGGRDWVETPTGGAFPAPSVLWVPKRSQCIEWLCERNWRVTVRSGDPSWVLTAHNPYDTRVMQVEGFGGTEIEALYAVMARILELDLG